ncbi:hypothetical protein F7725_010737 [Dissostichus mawsoni]|uniref:Calponin-homology (CH) domain-containing protein n=1 Tax=Dissostichus mawsoni TaxID=36200 RepID=A0A7J5Z7B0_DISMA|nr:hypothetical protein F7725_010737 [Dissostichus mawsoni]
MFDLFSNGCPDVVQVWSEPSHSSYEPHQHHSIISLEKPAVSVCSSRTRAESITMMGNSGFLEPPLPPQFFPDLTAEEEEDLPATEKDLAEDAPWKKIQQNTFTRWCNEHLKVVNKRMVDLQKDLTDGLKLIGLLEVLSQKKMYRKYHLRPNFRQMKLENVSVALEFLEREHIRLVSIGRC